jgi:hypothetical protein
MSPLGNFSEPKRAQRSQCRERQHEDFSAMDSFSFGGCGDRAEEMFSKSRFVPSFSIVSKACVFQKMRTFNERKEF